MVNAISLYSQNKLNFRGKTPNYNVISTKKEDDKQKLSSREVLAYSVAALTSGLLVKHRVDINKYAKLMGNSSLKTTSSKIRDLGEAATIDGMTQLGNKTNFIVNAIKDYKSAIKNGKTFNIAMLDMDNFKAINEVKDHPTGDIFLTRIAKNAKDIADKHGAKSYRYGGEEFVITSVGKSKEEMGKIMQEISETIKNDNELQKYLPEFMTDAQNQLAPIEKQLSFVQENIFDKLRNKLNKNERLLVKNNIKEFLNGYVEKYDPIDSSAIDKIIEAINNPNFTIKADAKIGDETLQVHLDKLIAPYKESKNDLLKWINHIKRHNAFTISGGYATINPDNKTVYETSKSLVDIADLSLKTAKVSGKNTMIEATDAILNGVHN